LSLEWKLILERNLSQLPLGSVARNHNEYQQLGCGNHLET
jgi:hypothetical protein